MAQCRDGTKLRVQKENRRLIQGGNKESVVRLIRSLRVSVSTHVNIPSSVLVIYREIGFAHFGREPVDFLLGVAEDNGLSDGEGIVQVAQGVELPLFFLHLNEKKNAKKSRERRG